MSFLHFFPAGKSKYFLETQRENFWVCFWFLFLNPKPACWKAPHQLYWWAREFSRVSLKFPLGNTGRYWRVCLFVCFFETAKQNNCWQELFSTWFVFIKVSKERERIFQSRLQLAFKAEFPLIPQAGVNKWLRCLFHFGCLIGSQFVSNEMLNLSHNPVNIIFPSLK